MIIFVCLITAAPTAAGDDDSEEAAADTTSAGAAEPIDINEARRRCRPPAIEGFPRPMTNAEVRARGGVAVHIAVAICMMLLIAVLCDDYFVPALDVLVKRWKLDAEVAGGTLMAAAGSASTLVYSFVGVNVAENELGISSTLGSGILKSAGVLSIAALCARGSVKLNAWPLLRSSAFSLLSMAIILWALLDRRIKWYEAALCLATYVLFVVTMAFNKHLEAYFGKLTGRQDHLKEETNNNSATVIDLESVGAMDVLALQPPARESSSFYRKLIDVIIAPFSFVVSCILSDCRKPDKERFYVPTLLISGGLTAVCSYVLVWMLAIIGFTFGIPDSILGLTMLSILSCLPDVVSSVVLVRKEQADVAISFLLGSNIFEVLVGLGSPWLIQTIRNPGTAVELPSRGLIYCTLCALLTTVLVVAFAFVARFRLNKAFGIGLLCWYIFFVLTSCLYHLNVFGNVNPPSCPSDY